MSRYMESETEVVSMPETMANKSLFMSRFIEFLTEVISKPEVMAALMKDPEKFMSEAGLSEEEKEVMRTRDRKKLEEYCAKHYNQEQQPKLWNIWWLS